MKAPWILCTAMALSGQSMIGGSFAAPLGGTGITAQSLPHQPPYLVLAQSLEAGTQDRISRLWHNRSIIEGALQGSRQDLAIEPPLPRTRALQPPQPMAAVVPQEPEVSPEPEPQTLLTAGAGDQVSCNAAARIVEDFGFTDVRSPDCTGELYRFSASRDGTGYSVAIRAQTGEIAEVSRE